MYIEFRRTGLPARAIFMIIFLYVMTNSLAAEVVTVKYRGPLSLNPFNCWEITRSSFIKRVCYDDAQSYLVINLNGTYYHYCEVSINTIEALLAASSMGKYFNQYIRGDGSLGPFDCRSKHTPNYPQLN